MTALLFTVLAAAGGLGAVSRMVLDGLIKSKISGSIPWGTIIINVSGSLALGLLTGLAAGHLVPGSWLLVVGTGYLGGYTTFSTASVETVRLMQQRRWMLSLITGLGTLVVATGAAGLGLWAGLQL